MYRGPKGGLENSGTHLFEGWGHRGGAGAGISMQWADVAASELRYVGLLALPHGEVK